MFKKNKICRIIFIFDFVILFFFSGCNETNKNSVQDTYAKTAQTNKKAEQPKTNYSLVVYKSDNIKGYKNKPVIVDYYFVPIIKRVNYYAKKYNLTLYVTSSFRTPKGQKKLSGTVVKPASMSNHLAGHAIDVNIVYRGKWYASGSMKKGNHNSLPYNVKAFINALRMDKYIRWGGDFTSEDPVHIDDHLNNNRKAWYDRYIICQKAYNKID